MRRSRHGASLASDRAWLDGRPLDGAALVAYLAALHDTGRAASSAALAVAGSTWGVRIQEPPPPDEATRFRMEQGRETEGEARGGGGLDARASPCRGSDIDTWTHERTS